MISDSDGDKITKFIGELKTWMLAMHSAFEAGDIPNGQKLGAEAAESLLTWNPVQHGAMTMALAFEAASLEAEVKELKEALDSWENPVVIPAGPVADAIDHFQAHPETGVRRESPARRGVMVGDNLTQVNHFNDGKDGSNG